MHRGYVGDSRHRKGNGKTATAVRQIKKLYNSQKYNVYSNIQLSFPHTLISPRELIKLAKTPGSLKHAVFFIDEIQNIFNSIGKGAANQVFNFIQNQTRKGDTHLIWTSQRLKNVDNRIVDDATIYHCSKWHYDGKRCYDQEDRCHKKHIVKAVGIYSKRGYAFKLNQSIFDLYNTAEVVPLAFFQHEKLRKELGEPKQDQTEIMTGLDGNQTEREFIKELKKTLGKKAIIRHNAKYNDGYISQFDIEVEYHGSLILFDVVGVSHEPKRKNMRLNSKHKNWGDKLEVMRDRNANGWIIFKNGTGWKGLNISRGADWMQLKGMITITENRLSQCVPLNKIFN